MILLLGILFRFAHLLALMDSDFPNLQKNFPASDMYGTIQWSKAIADGDLLSLNFERHFPEWMQTLGTQADWNRWWGHDKTLRQTPLYAYIFAAVTALFGL